MYYKIYFKFTDNIVRLKQLDLKPSIKQVRLKTYTTQLELESFTKIDRV